jgi:hypothetical protein
MRRRVMRWCDRLKRRGAGSIRPVAELKTLSEGDDDGGPHAASYALLLAVLMFICFALAFAQGANAAIGEQPRVFGEMEAQILVDLIIAGLTVLLNGAVTYGVTMTQLRWLRSDLDRHESDIEKIRDWQNEHVATFHERRSSSRRDRVTD